MLRNAGIPFEVQPANIAEDPLPGEKAKDCAERLAREKAQTVAQERPEDIVLGADTIVVIDDKILGKPANPDDAADMLRTLSGRGHQVITGVCLVRNGQARVASETTNVTMAEISEHEIAHYVATGEPMDKAGAYGIQGMASRWIRAATSTSCAQAPGAAPASTRPSHRVPAPVRRGHRSGAAAGGFEFVPGPISALPEIPAGAATTPACVRSPSGCSTSNSSLARSGC